MFKRLTNLGSGGYSDEEGKGLRGTTAPVHDLIPVLQLYGNMMVLKDGSYRMIMRVGAVNFELKSDREKMMILNAFGELLHILQVDFPIQVLLHSTDMDTEVYLAEYRERLLDASLTPQMRAVTEDHIQWFEEQARNNYLLDRSYFIVVPFWDRKAAPTGEAGVARETMPLGGMLSRFLDRSNTDKSPQKTRQDLEKARIQITNRCNLIAAQLSRLTISAQILDEIALMRLLRELYNPGVAARQRVSDEQLGQTGSFIHTIRRSDHARNPVGSRRQLPSPGGTGA